MPNGKSLFTVFVELQLVVKNLLELFRIFVVGNSSSKHSENVNNNFLIFGIMVITAIIMSVEHRSVNLKHLIMYLFCLGSISKDFTNDEMN